MKKPWGGSPFTFSSRLSGSLSIAAAVLMLSVNANAQDVIVEEATEISRERLELMISRMQSATFSSTVPGFPEKLEPEPLFRYDDPTRGYVDGTVWKLGQQGRPLALLTLELHPMYLGTGPRFVHEFLAITNAEFDCRLGSLAWSPQKSAVEMKVLRDGPIASPSETIRLAQMKRMADRFEARQIIQEITEQRIELRMLPTPIDRYSPLPRDRADGAVFLFVNGRNPGLALLIETDGSDWKYGIGRLSLPSRLVVTLDRKTVASWERSDGTGGQAFYAANVPGIVPGYEADSLPEAP